MLNRGIILIATSHPYYGRMAFNLCCTIKAVEHDFPVAVVHDIKGLSHLSERQLKVFDQTIQLPENINSGFTPKLHLIELSPFGETVFLDADMLWLPSKTPTQLFDEVSGVDYTGITEGWCDLATDDNSNSNLAYYFWADLAEIKKVYNLNSGKIYQWRSEFIYFKKNELTESFFKKAQEIHKDPKLESIRKFAGMIPDELGINISAAVHGINPHVEKWSPAYWHKLHKDVIPEPSALHNWYLISFGSNYSSGTIKKLYDRVASVALKKLGMQHIFSLHSKKEFMTERFRM